MFIFNVEHTKLSHYNHFGIDKELEHRGHDDTQTRQQKPEYQMETVRPTEGSLIKNINIRVNVHSLFITN